MSASIMLFTLLIIFSLTLWVFLVLVSAILYFVACGLRMFLSPIVSIIRLS